MQQTKWGVRRVLGARRMTDALLFQRVRRLGQPLERAYLGIDLRVDQGAPDHEVIAYPAGGVSRIGQDH